MRLLLTVRKTLANIAMISEFRNKFHWYFSDPKNTFKTWVHSEIPTVQGYNPRSQTLPWSNFYRDSKGPPPPKLVFQLWTETTCWRFSSQIRMDCPMIAPKKDRSCTTKTVGTHLRYIDSIDLSLVGKTFYPSPRQKSRSSLIFRCITHQLKFQRFWLHTGKSLAKFGAVKQPST